MASRCTNQPFLQQKQPGPQQEKLKNTVTNAT